MRSSSRAHRPTTMVSMNYISRIIDSGGHNERHLVIYHSYILRTRSFSICIGTSFSITSVASRITQFGSTNDTLDSDLVRYLTFCWRKEHI
jgi:hypothetical protein